MMDRYQSTKIAGIVGIIGNVFLFIITYNALEENNIINFAKYIQILSILVLVITFILENNITYYPIYMIMFIHSNFKINDKVSLNLDDIQI